MTLFLADDSESGVDSIDNRGDVDEYLVALNRMEARRRAQMEQKYERMAADQALLRTVDQSLHNVQRQHKFNDREDIEKFLADLDHLESQFKTQMDKKKSDNQGQALKKVQIPSDTWHFMNTFDQDTPPGDPGPSSIVPQGKVDQVNQVTGGHGTLIDVRPRGPSTNQGLIVQQPQVPETSGRLASATYIGVGLLTQEAEPTTSPQPGPETTEDSSAVTPPTPGSATGHPEGQ